MNKKLLAIALVVVAAIFGGEINPPNSNDEIFLYRAVEKVAPGHFPLNQGKLGSCVAFGHAAACDVLLAIDKLSGKSGKWLPASPDSLYGGARNESYGRASNSYRAGSNGSAATRWLKDVGGVIYQQKYANVDLSHYDIKRTADWGAAGNGGRADGINGPFDAEAKLHPIKSVAKVTTLEELDAALKNGWPVTLCSGQGFDTTRDKDGFCRAQGSWSHCLVCLGKRNEGRKGYLILNSWGNAWVSGPKYRDQPDGSFYCEPSVMARILRAGDSWALSNAEGFKPSILPHWLLKADASADAATQKPSLVVFSATWCVPCKTLKATLESPEVKAKLADYEVFVIDVDADKASAQLYEVSTVPAFFLLDSESRIVARGTGAKTPREFIEWLNGV